MSASTASRVGRPLGRDRLPHRDRDPPTEPQPARAVDRDRDDRDAGSQGEVRRPLAQRQKVALEGVDPALARDGDHAAGRQDALHSSGRVAQVRLGRLVRDRRPGPGHQPVPTAGRHVVLLRPEERQPRPHRQGRHQQERIRPAQVVEAVDGRGARQPIAVDEPDPEVGADQAPDDDPSEPVPRGHPGDPDPARPRRLGHGRASGSRSLRRSRTMSARLGRARCRRHARVRDEDHGHPGRLAGTNAVEGVLHHEARLGRDKQPRRGFEVHVRGGLAVRDLVGRHRHVEGIAESGGLERDVDHRPVRR